MEADALSHQRLGFGRQRVEAGGLRECTGLLSAAYAKDGADPQWDNDPGMKKWSRIH